MHVRPAARPLRLGDLMSGGDAATSWRVAATFLLALVLMVAATADIAAQAPRDTARFRLDSLQVPVTRSAVARDRAPVALSFVGRDAIQRARPGIGLDEALAAVPGLIVNNRQNFSLGNRIVIRGLGARAAFGVRGVRVLVDGIPLTMADGQTNLNNLDLGSAGAIHVLRGPASALFGNATGGVIAVETEPPPGPRSAEARVTLGDQGRGSVARLVKAQLKVAETIGGVDYLVSGSRLQADGFRDHGRVRQSLFNGRAGWTPRDATRLSVVLSVVDMPVAENPGALPLDSMRNRPSMAWARNVETHAGETTRQGQLGVRVLHELSGGRADVSLYGLRRSLENPLPFGYIDLDRTGGGVRALVEHDVAVTFAPVLTVGFDVDAQRDDRREYANVDGQPTGTARRDQQDRVTSIGPFAQVRAGGTVLGVTAGARYDAVRFESLDRRGVEPDQSGARTLHAPSLMLGATATAGGVTFFGNIASAFQTPTTTELINAPPAPGEACCPAGFNRGLEPQRALSREIGVRGAAGPRIRYEITAYRMDVRDALIQFQVPEAEGRDFFRNAARTRHRGIEIGTGAAVARSVSVTAAYTLTDVHFRDYGSEAAVFEGNRVPGIPPHRLHVGASWSHRASHIGAELQHYGRQHTNDGNTTQSEPFTVLDVRAQTALVLGQAEFAPFVSLNNVLDTRYPASLTVNAAAGRFYEPAPGFNVYIGTSVRTGAWRRR